MSHVETLEGIKGRDQFFSRGSIIPQRVLRCENRKMKHTVKFGSDAWVIPCKTGYLVICDTSKDENSSAIRITRGWRNGNLWGSPYHLGGGTTWVGNSGQSAESFEQAVLKHFATKNEQFKLESSQ